MRCGRDTGLHDGIGWELAVGGGFFPFAEKVRLRHAGLLRGLKGVERHVIGAVADGVEAELEAGDGALGGHLVEVVLLKARDAGVRGLVVVGRFHRCGAGAERAIHEALEHAEMQQRIVEVVAGAALLEVADRKVEVDPLVDAERKFIFALEGFEDEPSSQVEKSWTEVTP